VQASLQSPRRENKGAARADLDSGVSGVTRWCGRGDTYDEEEKTCCRINSKTDGSGFTICRRIRRTPSFSIGNWKWWGFWRPNSG